METFNARPVNRTRLIELICQSTSPDVAAAIPELRWRTSSRTTAQQIPQKTAQKTSEWVAGQIEETKAKVAEAEERLRDFVQASGNVFAGQDATLDDTKLAQLKGELAKIQSAADHSPDQIRANAEVPSRTTGGSSGRRRVARLPACRSKV